MALKPTTSFGTACACLLLLSVLHAAVASDGSATGAGSPSSITSKLSQFDTSMAGQMSITGGSFHIDPEDETQMLLTLNGVGQKTLLIDDPTNPSTVHPVEHSIVTGSFAETPRFSVLVTNNSDTWYGLPKVQFVAMALRKLVSSTPAGSDENGEDGSLTYAVDILSQDITNSTGTVGLMSPREYFQREYHFPAGMMLIDFTKEGANLKDDYIPSAETGPNSAIASTNDSARTDSSQHSLRALAYAHGMDYGRVPVALSEEEGAVGAQGVFTTAFLGPFNIWAWVCCAYKIPEHLLIGWVAPPSYVVLFLCCV